MKVLKEPSFTVGKKKQFILASKMVVLDEQKELQIVIPKGFTTDFASIPRLATLGIPVNGKHRLPAVVHDFLYQRQGNIAGVPVYDRRAADKVFKSLMKDYGVERWRIKAMYRAVRWFGWQHWG